MIKLNSGQMKALTRKEAEKLATKPRGKRSRVRAEVEVMAVGDIRLLTKEEWTRPTQPPYHMVRQIEQSYDFNKMMSQSKTWGEYHNQTINKVADRFQDTISKYSHKLPVEDLKLLEHFGGGSRFFAIFAVIQTMSGMIVTTTEHGVPIYENRPIINPFAKVSQDNLKKHFQQLLMLVDTYNQSAETDYEKWDLKALTSLDKIEELNGKTDVKW